MANGLKSNGSEIYTYKKSEFLILLVKSRPKCAPSSTQNNGKITSGIVFMISTSGIGFTSKLNCNRLAADNGLPVNYSDGKRKSVWFHLNLEFHSKMVAKLNKLTLSSSISIP